MFERFTDRARKVFTLAESQAQRLGHDCVDTEHVLLGLVEEGSGVGANVLKNLGADARGVLAEIEGLVQPGPDGGGRQKPSLSPLCTDVVRQATAEARELGHTYVGTEHLLLGLVAKDEGVAVRVLENLHIRPGAVRQAVQDLLAAAGADGDRAAEGRPTRAPTGPSGAESGGAVDGLDEPLIDRLNALGAALIDQEAARVAIPPQQAAEGFWFGGGNLAVGPDGALYLVGRYRNVGDSRTGLEAGQRGLELAVFRSDDGGEHFEKVLSFSKSRLSAPDRDVLSIEGSALLFGPDGVELFVSSEKKQLPYPPGLADYLKPGAGVWSIDRLVGDSVEDLEQSPVIPLLVGTEPAHWHVKDPFVYTRRDGRTVLGFCTHPFSWASSNSAMTFRPAGERAFGRPVYDFFPRGACWDVAITRMTHLLKVPEVGPFGSVRPLALAFYDGGESLRAFPQHDRAVKRPRGHSCEELGGLAVAAEANLTRLRRLSVHKPAFVSPHGLGTSRYVDVLATEDAFIATWQQAQPDGSQPLVIHRLPRGRAESLLA